jgi:hypothetical protein
MATLLLENHRVLVWLHVLLAIYWLGPDWGVYVNSRYVARADLPLAERRRFLEAALRIDLVPRSCLILLLPAGLLLAGQLGLSPVTGAGLAAVWAGAIAWLLLSWRIYRRPGDAATAALRQLDHGIRWVLATLCIVTALYSLATGTLFLTTWLPLKLLGFGTLLLLGLALRAVMGGWAMGFQRLAAEGSTPATEAVFAGALRRARPIAWIFWSVSAALAFLGVVKPG